jgi:DNA-binding PadR family transcriptional regulator
MSITDNFELIEGMQLSNSFMIFMILDIAKEYLLTLSDISKTIFYNSLGHIYKPASIHIERFFRKLLKKRENGYVEGIVKNNKTYYKITSRGKKLLKGWISFLSVYQSD